MRKRTFNNLRKRILRSVFKKEEFEARGFSTQIDRKRSDRLYYNDRLITGYQLPECLTGRETNRTIIGATIDILYTDE